jgi:hypothetical protein
VTLIASTLWGEQPEVITRAARRANVILTPRIGKGNAADPATRNDSLTALRLTLAASVDVLVAIGGKLHQKTGYNPGVLEELAVARWSGVPCFVVASYGGLAGMLETEAIRQFSIGNRLDDSMHGPMASWGDDVEKFVGQLVEHFIRSRTVLAQPHKVAPVSWHRLVSRGVEQFVGNARIDSGLVRRSSKRFAKLKEALDGSDIGRVRSLLRSRSSGGGDR